MGHPAGLVVFLAFWIAMARNQKAVAVKIEWKAETTHYLPLAVTIALLVFPIPVFLADARFVPRRGRRISA